MGTPKEIFRSLRNYLAGQFVGATRDEILLDELLKCLFCKLYIELGLTSSFNEKVALIDYAKAVRIVFSKVREDFPDIYNSHSEILLDPESILRVMTDCSFSLIDAASDPIGDAFEVFVGSESRSRSGQFFTPRSVTDLLVKMIEPNLVNQLLTLLVAREAFYHQLLATGLKKGFTNTIFPNLLRKHFLALTKMTI